MTVPLSLLVAVLTVSAIGQHRTSADLIRAGDAAYAAFDNATATTLYQKATERDPANFTAWTRLVLVQNDDGRIALRRSDSSEVYYRRALASAETLIIRFPERAESWFLLALCHGSLVPFKGIRDKLNIGRDVEANLRRSLALDPTYAMSHVLLGIYYRSAAQLSWTERTIANTILGKHIVGSLEESEHALRTAIRLRPQSPFAYYELASTLRNAGRHEEAISMLRTVISLPYVGARERLQYEDAQRRLLRWQEPVASPAGP